MADIFVSYASQDRARIKPLVEILEENGWSVWWDRDLVAGPSFDAKIQEALDAARCVVIAWSENAVVSSWCRDEAQEGLQRQCLVPLRIDDVRPPLGFRSSQTASLIGWPRERDELENVLSGIRQCIGEESEESEALGTALTLGTTKRRGLNRAALLFSIILFIFIAAGWWYLDSLISPATPELTSRGESNESVREDRFSLAVLPFSNLSPNPEHEYFAIGIHDEVLNEVARHTDILVKARRSVLQYAQSQRPIEAIASELGVNHLLEGSVRFAGGKIRIQVQLVDGQNGINLWSETFDRDFADVFAIQAEVARQVASVLGTKFVESSNPVVTINVEAYQEYLLARVMRFESERYSWEQIVAQTNKALDHDPNFVPALWILHNYYQNGASQSSRTEEIEQMRRITRRAERADPNHAITLALLAKEAMWDWNWSTADDYWSRAMKTDPGDSINLGDGAYVALALGDTDRALDLAHRSISVDRGGAWGTQALIDIQVARGMHEAASQLVESSRELSLAHYTQRKASSILVAAARGDHTGLPAYQALIQPFGEQFVKSGTAAFEAILEKDAEKAEKLWIGPLGPVSVEVALILGNQKVVFNLLDRIVNERRVYTAIQIAIDPVFSPIRDHPRFQDFLSRTNLLAYES